MPVALVVKPQGPAGQAGAPEPVRMTAPGRRTVELDPGAWRIQGEAAGYWSEEQIVSLRPGEPGALLVRLFPTGTVRGRLEWPRDQKPPDRLDVRFGPAPDGERTVPKGLISCPVRNEIWECAVPAGTADLRLRAEAFIPLYRWGVRVKRGQTMDLGVLAFRPGASVVGRVVTEGGTAASGVAVELSLERLGALGEPSTGLRLDALALEARTNDRGFFQFQGVAPGSYEVTARSTGMAPARLAPVLVREALEAEIIDPLILARPATLQVDLFPPLDPYGNPWKLKLFQEANAGGALGLAAQGQADLKGRWLWKDLPPGKYRLWVLGDLESRWIDQEIQLFPGAVPVPVDVPVVEVRGVLTIGDSPLAGTLWFGGSSGSQRIRFDADEEGEFAGFLPRQGTWSVDLVAESEGLRLALEPVEVRIAPRKGVAEVEIRVPDTTLEGEVVDETGRGVPGSHISLSGARKQSDVVAGDEGKFRLRGLAPGYAFVEAMEGDRSAGPVQISVEEGRPNPRLRLTLRSNLHVRGRVVSAAGGVGVPGAEVIAWPTLGEVPFASDDSAVSGPDGSFTLRFPVQTTSISLFVFAPGYAFRMARMPVLRDRPLEVLVEPGGGTLVLELPRATGDAPAPSPILVHGGTFTPLPLIALWASRQRAEQTGSGSLVVPRVESGEYSLCLNAGAELSQGKEPAAGRCVSGSLAFNGELTLSLAGD